MTRSEIRYIVLRSIGNFLILFAIFGVIATFGPVVMDEIKFQIVQYRGIHYTVAGVSVVKVNQQPISSSPGFASLLSGQKQQVLVAPNIQFSVVIPKIGASARIFPNVDVTNENEFLSVLQQGVAHAKGSVFPGMKGTTYLFAHSTDSWLDVSAYNAVFYLLKDMNPGDEIVIFFEGRRYNYTVSRIVISDPSDTSLLDNSHNSAEQLVLQTCWPPGTTWKRLFVIAIPKK
ncbi:MAG TPA: sortase [Patescibacteria group bacterium]|nr:sortase [Patescibacteria group bacterium]